MSKVTTATIRQMKSEGKPITMLTAYDYSMAKLVDDAGIDMILVGDSLANVMLGYDSTLPVTMDEMVHHVKAVCRGAVRAMVVADLPFPMESADVATAAVLGAVTSRTRYAMIDHVTSASALVLPVGTKVRFVLTADDVIHAWWVPALGWKQDAIPGLVNEAWAQIEKPGVYRGQCAELCGKDHGFMPIVVKAVSKPEFDTWLAAEKARLAPPAAAEADAAAPAPAAGAAPGTEANDAAPAEADAAPQAEQAPADAAAAA